MDRLPRQRRRRRPRSVVPAAAVLGAIAVFGSDYSHALQGSSSVARQRPSFHGLSTTKTATAIGTTTSPNRVTYGKDGRRYYLDTAATPATKLSASPLIWPNTNDSSTPISILSRQDLLRELAQTKKNKEEDPTRRQQEQQDTQLQPNTPTTTPNKSSLVVIRCLFALNAGMLIWIGPFGSPSEKLPV